MTGLSKTQREKQASLVRRLQEAAEAVSAYEDSFNQAVAQQQEKMDTAVDAYNAILAEASNFVSDVIAEAEQTINEKNEEAVGAFLTEWENIDLEPIQVDYSDAVEVPSLCHGGDLEDLPSSTEE